MNPGSGGHVLVESRKTGPLQPLHRLCKRYDWQSNRIKDVDGEERNDRTSTDSNWCPCRHKKSEKDPQPLHIGSDNEVNYPVRDKGVKYTPQKSGKWDIFHLTVSGFRRHQSLGSFGWSGYRSHEVVIHKDKVKSRLYINQTFGRILIKTNNIKQSVRYITSSTLRNVIPERRCNTALQVTSKNFRVESVMENVLRWQPVGVG